MKVFITGATGYVGGAVLRELVRAGHKPICLVRRREAMIRIEEAGGEARLGDVRRTGDLDAAMNGCEAVIHLVAIIREIRRLGITFEAINERAARNTLEAAEKHGIRRFIHMSALGADPEGITPYFRTKGRAEQGVRNSSLAFTVFRPSFVFGPGAEVYRLLARMIRLSPFGLVPVFGDGEYRHQPVHVDDVARGLVRALSRPDSEGRCYDVGGPQPITYRRQLELLGDALGRRVHPLRFPLILSRPAVRILGWFPLSPIDLDRLNMLVRDNVCDPGPFLRDFNIEPLPFPHNMEL